MNQKEFAAHIGKTPGFITHLKQAGRIVLLNDGQVDVEATLKLIADTETPSHVGVKEHHQRKRKQKQASIELASSQFDSAHREQSDLPHAESPGNEANENNLIDLHGNRGSLYHDARTVREIYVGLREKRSYEKEIGDLRDADEVEFIAQDAVTIFRNRIDSMFHSLAPQLADERDEQKILHIMLDEWEIICRDLQRRLNEMAKS